MRQRAAFAVAAASVFFLIIAPIGPASAVVKYYFDGTTVQQKWHSGGTVTSNKNVSQGQAAYAHAYSRVGGIEAYSGNPGVVQTYATKTAKVECGWANKTRPMDRKIAWQCKWER